jgi:hypothetical protein
MRLVGALMLQSALQIFLGAMVIAQISSASAQECRPIKPDGTECISPGNQVPDPDNFAIKIKFTNGCTGKIVVTAYSENNDGSKGAHSDIIDGGKQGEITCTTGGAKGCVKFTNWDAKCSSDNSSERALSPPPPPPAASVPTPPPQNTTAANSDFCNDLTYAVDKIQCSVDCQKDAKACEQWKTRALQQLHDREKERQKEVEKERQKLEKQEQAKKLAFERACGGGVGKCALHCINRFPVKPDQDACLAVCRRGYDSCIVYQLDPRKLESLHTQFVPTRRPTPPPPAQRPTAPSPAGSDCPPGMVHDPRINPRECIRL